MQKLLTLLCKLSGQHHMILLYEGSEGKHTWCKTCGLDIIVYKKEDVK